MNDRELDGTYLDFELPLDCPTAFVYNCDEITSPSYKLRRKIVNCNLILGESVKKIM